MKSSRNPKDRIFGLQAIANYCDLSIPTVKKYEQKYGLPLYKQGSKDKPRYYAWPDELDEWIARGQFSIETTESTTRPPTQRRQGSPKLRLRYVALLTAAALLIGLLPLLRGWVARSPSEPRAPATTEPRDPPANLDVGITFRSRDQRLEVMRGEQLLWARPELEPARIAKARLTQGGPPVAVALTVPRTADPRVPPMLLFLSLESGIEERQPRRLLSGSNRFPHYSNTWEGRLDAIDLNGDGIDEIIASFKHAPNWPSYSVVYAPLEDLVYLAYVSSGHHGLVATVDLDDDGQDELLFEGQNNFIGWRSGVAAVRLVPRLDEPSGNSAMSQATSPNLDPRWKGVDGLVWHWLGSPTGCTGSLRCIEVDRELRHLRIRSGSDAGVVLDFHGLPIHLQVDSPPEQLAERRRLAYKQARTASMALQSGEAEIPRVATRKAIVLLEDTGLENELDWFRHLEIRAVALAGDLQLTLDLARNAEQQSESRSAHLFEVALALHLGGFAEEAAHWYRRGLDEGAVSRAHVRPQWEFLRGLILSLHDAGLPDSALDAVSEYERRVSPKMAGKLHSLARWRASCPISRETALAMTSDVEDYVRYWGFEILSRHEYLAPDDLLQRIERELPFNSEASSLLRSLDAWISAKHNGDAEAPRRARDALARARAEAYSNAVVKSHLGLLEERLGSIVNLADRSEP